jgi:hypothetical protein
VLALCDGTPMYIRRTKVKGGPRGEVYITHRLVESVRTEKGVRQRTLLNLGKDFPVPPERWAELIQHLEQVLAGQSALVPLPGDSRRARPAAGRTARAGAGAAGGSGRAGAGLSGGRPQ